jgi:hypothetical protein
MKKVILLLVVLSLFVMAFRSDGSEKEIYTPIFMSREMLENSVMYVVGARDMKQTGKIYYRAPYIYVNERYKGVHVINNTNPASPVNEGFILAPGCIDMAVKGNILYLDNAVDLVSFDLDSKQVTKRIKNVFPEPLPPENFSYHLGYSNRPKDYILVEWRKNN